MREGELRAADTKRFIEERLFNDKKQLLLNFLFDPFNAIATAIVNILYIQLCSVHNKGPLKKSSSIFEKYWIVDIYL